MCSCLSLCSRLTEHEVTHRELKEEAELKHLQAKLPAAIKDLRDDQLYYNLVLLYIQIASALIVGLVFLFWVGPSDPDYLSNQFVLVLGVLLMGYLVVLNLCDEMVDIHYNRLVEEIKEKGRTPSLRSRNNLSTRSTPTAGR